MTTCPCIYFILVKGCNIFLEENTCHISFLPAANVETLVVGLLFLNWELQPMFILLLA